MRIEAVHTLKVGGIHYAPGSILEAEDAVAAVWIGNGDARPCAEPHEPGPEVESPVVPEPEDAAEPEKPVRRRSTARR